LPPNVFYIEEPFEGHIVRAKYAVVSREQFLKGTSPAAFHPSLWARFSQPVALLHARDKAISDEMTAAVAEAVKTMLAASGPLVASPASPSGLWLEALGQTYRAELRPESSERTRTIYQADARRYDRMAQIVFADGLMDDGRIRLQTTAEQKRRARRSWFWRRLIGKPLSVLRLMKSLFTFDGGVDYALWKVERHTGVRVPVSSFERRHPILNAPRLLWRVFRLSVVR
ncbi:MAG: diacylglycerol kinase family protein, partial [Geminicoccaceae bacterium]